MIVYVDSSALLKRAVAEPESDVLESALAAHVGNEDAIVASSLAWIEVERAVRALLSARPDADVGESVRAAMSGVAERFVGADVVSLARRIEPPVLRTLDAIHVASAVLLDADLVVTYDDRLAAAARHNSLAVASPGSTDDPDQ